MSARLLAAFVVLASLAGCRSDPAPAATEDPCAHHAPIEGASCPRLGELCFRDGDMCPFSLECVDGKWANPTYIGPVPACCATQSCTLDAGAQSDGDVDAGE